MYRYLALIWEPDDSSAAAAAKALALRLQSAAEAWERVVDARNLLLFHSGAGCGSSDTRALAEGAGAVCGTLFPRETTDAELSDPRAILTRAWGRYVAVLREARTGVVRVLRDPTGTLPCFVTRHERVHIVVSDVETCLSLGLRFSVNWRYIAAYVPYSALQIRATGLNEITEVQPGECLTIAAGTAETELLWSPLDARRRGLIEDPSAAAAMVREAVRSCVHAWASLHRAVIHNLSGGLDSSIVLSCLVNA
ncbi:MAG TPA: hypothetical protein VG994_02120, partial [Steroidobacteraceae bacterium]|nr:hypothetical protein [Steroidobacteraceae bacterium]